MTNNATHGTLCLLHRCLHSIADTHCTSSEPFSSLGGYQMVISPSLNMQCPFWGQWCTHRSLSHLTDWLTAYKFLFYSLCWTILLALWNPDECSMFLHNTDNHPPNNRAMPQKNQSLSLLLFLIHQTPIPLPISFSVLLSTFHFPTSSCFSFSVRYSVLLSSPLCSSHKWPCLRVPTYEPLHSFISTLLELHPGPACPYTCTHY